MLHSEPAGVQLLKELPSKDTIVIIIQTPDTIQKLASTLRPYADISSAEKCGMHPATFFTLPLMHIVAS